MIDRKHARRSFTEEESERLRGVVRDFMAKKHLSQTLAAESIGITQPSLSAFLLGKQGAGTAFARGLAEAIGTTVDVLLGWERAPTSLAAMHDDPVPKRGAAIVLGREAGVSDAAITKLQKISPTAYKDTFSWLERLVRIERDLREESPRPAPLPGHTKGR